MTTDPHDGHARLFRAHLRAAEPAHAGSLPSDVHRIDPGAGMGSMDTVQLPSLVCELAGGRPR